MKKYTRKCPTCNTVFSSSYKNREFYCSSECFKESRRIHIEKICEYCGEIFIARNSQQADKRFCSHDCANKATFQKDNSKSIFMCEWCNKDFEEWTYRQPRFCSRQCTSEFAARQPKTRSNPQEFVTRYCEQCWKEYTVSKSQIKHRGSRFCSRECGHKWRSENIVGEAHPRYKGGSKYSDRGSNWGKQRKRALKRDGRTCQICGYHQKMKKPFRYIDVHHIVPYKIFDGDYKTANKLSNLITLCRSCHSDVESGRMACPKRLF